MGGILRPGAPPTPGQPPATGPDEPTDAPPAKRVVIVDDSPTMRGVIARLLERDPRLCVVGTAADPYEAREVIKQTNPDVITLDIEMPRMNGLAFLEKIMRLRPMPVVMLSSVTQDGSRSAIEALSLGAVDCVGKPTGGADSTFGNLAERVFTAACATVRQRIAPSAQELGGQAVAAEPAPKPEGPRAEGFQWGGIGVLIGASTGGVDALERVLGALPREAPPILITQHMPASFLESFAQRLSGRVAPRVVLAQDGAPIRQGEILIAPGGARHMTVEGGPRNGTVRLIEGPKRAGHRPSVDVLFDSALGRYATDFVAVLLTGMGRDGAEGMLALREAGAATIAQDEASSVVYGMPRVAHEIGAAQEVVPLEMIAKRLLEMTGRPPRRGVT